MSAIGLVAACAVLTALLIAGLMPLLRRYALARPNVRSSHMTPTPQGAGIAIVASVIGVVLAGGALGWLVLAPWLLGFMAAAMALAVLGTLDDIQPMPVLPRLMLQFAAAATIVLTLPTGMRALPWLPHVLELALLIVGLVWFINLTNFMDGIDGMTVVEVVPIAGALALIGLLELAALPPGTAVVCLALLGAMIGFAPFNRHVARLFLGDVGSLPIGAMVGGLLILLAGSGHVVAAVILPLYYLGDATITLVRRWRRGEKVHEAHRTHFYQLATARGFSVPQVTARVLALNVVLGMIALATVTFGQTWMSLVNLAVACALTGLVLRQFERGRT